MLPEKVYEVLPFAYIGAGIGLMIGYESWLLMAAGMLMAGAGAVIWILRSDNRRSDIKGAREKYGGVLPFWFYELLPFSYFMIALTLFIVSDNTYVYPFAMILMVIGVQLWGLRTSYRKHQRPAPVKVRPGMRSRA
ncbi:MAG TPA: hypothetical protein VLA40_08140 [Rheinheimera sp.]|nr:hypothetical protein [Rheinheimera sp.]